MFEVTKVLNILENIFVETDFLWEQFTGSFVMPSSKILNEE